MLAAIAYSVEAKGARRVELEVPAIRVDGPLAPSLVAWIEDRCVLSILAPPGSDDDLLAFARRVDLSALRVLCRQRPSGLGLVGL